MLPNYQFKLYIGHKTNVEEIMDVNPLTQSVDTKSLSTLGLYKDQLRTQILKNKYQLGTKCDSKKEDIRLSLFSVYFTIN